MAIDAARITEYVELLEQLSGVMGANILLAGENIIEVHILSDFSRSPKQIVRDVQSALNAKFGVEIDHKIISVAQVSSEAIQQLGEKRLMFEEVSIKRRREHTEVRVGLSYGGEVKTAEGSTGNETDEIHRFICEVTLQTLKQFFPHLTFSLLDLHVFQLAGQDVVSVCVGLRKGGYTERYLGCSLMEDDFHYAFVKAILDALNRRLSTELNKK